MKIRRKKSTNSAKHNYDVKFIDYKDSISFDENDTENKKYFNTIHSFD